ncbi:MAG: sulfatase-like hydrolase/transferase, partial [Rhodospirillales bacterium]|nr:sulfatase-like hydrolase/transferase [Rhodospirillales bacterium]
MALGQVGGCKNRQADPRPNVIVILVDDLSAGELGCYGSTANNTPQLDKLAASGVRFATCWSTPACLPSRVQLLTGRYGFRTGVYHRRDRLGGPDNDFKITDHLTLPGLLQSAGYRTMVAGKWKLVPPADAGFDHAAIWLSNMRQMSEKERANFDGGVESATTRRPGRTSRYWHPAIRVDGSLVNTDKDDYGPDIFLDRVVDFANRRDHRPFFVYYPMVLPHGPYEPTPPISEGTGPLDASFKLHVRYMDHVIGELASRLDQAGLLTNTIVLVTADNGSVSGGKDEVSERGVHVPLIAFGGPVVARAEPSSRLVDSSDFLPTVLEFAGVSLPSDYTVDGVSFAPTLRGEPSRSRPWIFSYLAGSRMLRDDRGL